MTNKEFGNIGEDYIEKYLIKNRCEIVERNYYTRYGEIDIIAKNSKYILFVEVKTRRETSKIRPSDSVGYRKQQKMKITADLYLQKIKNKTLQPRFDVAELILNRRTLEIIKLNYIKNAF